MNIWRGREARNGQLRPRWGLRDAWKSKKQMILKIESAESGRLGDVPSRYGRSDRFLARNG